MYLEEDIKLVGVTLETKNILENLISLYLHDLSQFVDDLKVNNDGKFEYDGFEFYFKYEELNPFLIYCNDEVAGFILLNLGKFVPSTVQYSIHELFILKSFRKKRVATRAIKKVFETYKGKYKVGQLQNNELAVEFWKRFYKNQDINYEETVEVEDGFNCYTQIFTI